MEGRIESCLTNAFLSHPTDNFEAFLGVRPEMENIKVLVGTIPSELGLLTELEELFLGENH